MLVHPIGRRTRPVAPIRIIAATRPDGTPALMWSCTRHTHRQVPPPTGYADRLDEAIQAGLDHLHHRHANADHQQTQQRSALRLVVNVRETTGDSGDRPSGVAQQSA